MKKNHLETIENHLKNTKDPCPKMVKQTNKQKTLWNWLRPWD